MENPDNDGTDRTLAEAAYALNAAHPEGHNFPPLFFFTDEARCPDPLPILKRLPKGCGIVFRHYETANRAEMAARVLDAAQAQGRCCLIGGDEDLAQSLGADGLHLPEHMVVGFRRTESEDNWLITAAAHGEEALDAASTAKVDAAFLSPVFETPSHAGGPALGLERFRELAQSTPLPIYALGGITTKTAPQLLGQDAGRNVIGLGAIGALLGLS